MKLLAQQPTQHCQTRCKIAIVTGLSDPSHCKLSVAQLAFLEAMVASVKLPRREQLQEGTMRSNFPFLSQAAQDAHVESDSRPTLVSASWNNAWQYIQSSTHTYRELSKPHWEAFFRSAERFYLITGSCGLQLVGEALRNMPDGPSVEILAIGPVASKRSVVYIQQSSRVSITKVQGSLDWISQFFIRHDCCMIPRLGHLQYWTDRTTQEFACNWLLRKTSEL
jgi:hypothetical protein